MNPFEDQIIGCCPIVLDQKFFIQSFGKVFPGLLGLSDDKLVGTDFCELLTQREPSWGPVLRKFLTEKNGELELKPSDETSTRSFSIQIQAVYFGEHIHLTISMIGAHGRPFEYSVKEIIDDPSKVSELFLRLQRTESRLNSYMQHFPGVFFFQRADFSFQYISPNFEKMLELSPDRLLRSGSQFLGMILERDRDYFVSEIRKHSQDSTAFTIQFRIRKAKDNSTIYLTDVRSPVYSENGMLLGYEGVWLDTTRQTIAERKLTSSAWKENLAMLTAGLVHDFSNVMAGIYALSELYHSSIEPDNSMYEGLGQIKKSSMEARKLVRRIIDINREEAGQKNYHDPKKLICDQLDLLKIIFPKGTQIELDLTGEEIPIYIDDIEFRQILLNLAMNSKDAIQKQGIIHIRTRRVKNGEKLFESAHEDAIDTKRDGILIEFEDNGSGIPLVYRDRIFNSFFTTKEIHKGSGFGLYNIRRILKSAGGEISFQTEEDAGTTFIIYLPEADFTEQLNETPATKTASLPKLEQRPIVVVFGNEEVFEYDLISMLQAKNWEVIAFSKVPKLESYLEDCKRSPSLCLLIDVDISSEPSKVCKLFDKLHPDTLLAMLSIGRNIDEIPENLSRDLAIIYDSSMSPNNIVQNLEKLISSPIKVE